MTTRPTDEEIRTSFERWFAGTNPSGLDFSNPEVQKGFAYQAWKDARLAERQAARDEWKLVPVEPTSEMLDAPKWTRIECERIYRAMLSAAPAYNGKKEG